jgi:hypothetical protein
MMELIFNSIAKYVSCYLVFDCGVGGDECGVGTTRDRGKVGGGNTVDRAGDDSRDSIAGR